MSSLPRILIADNSRVVRATLAKHLAGHFEIIEESNGESAWQTLVLDGRIVAVIAGVQLQKLSGHGLVERLRENKLERLKRLPFFLIVSDTESEEGREKARSLGVSDFLTKMMKKGEILQRVEALVKAGNDHGAAAKEVPVAAAQPVSRGAAHDGEKTRLLSRQEIEAKLSEALDAPGRRGEPLSVLVLEVGNYGSLVAGFGQEVADKICGRFSHLLLGTVRGDDSIGLYRPERCVIVSQGVGFAQCSAFAERLRAAVSTAQIAVHGKPIKLTVDAGVASVPDDGALSGEELLAVAASRMKTGGGSKRKAAVAKKAWLDIEIPALRTLASLLGSSPEEVEPHLGTLGMEVMPLLKAIDRAFGFGLPLPEMERRLAERAQEEGVTQ